MLGLDFAKTSSAGNGSESDAFAWGRSRKPSKSVKLPPHHSSTETAKPSFGKREIWWPSCWAALLIVQDRLRCGLAQFKLGTHFLDFGSLLSELGCESLYLFLLLRDRCLQPLNSVIEHGLVLGADARLRCATRDNYAALHR